MPQRKIIHIDCDCFYAAIEMRDDPRLAGRPMAVGGQPGQRGVIATCNYEARAYGVRSAMASGHALKLCPDLEIVKPRFEAYKEASREIHTIFRDYTDLIEPLSLDEAYLDVTDSQWFAGSATRIAEDIRKRVARQLHITVSAGSHLTSSWPRSPATGASPTACSSSLPIRWKRSLPSCRSRACTGGQGHGRKALAPGY